MGGLTFHPWNLLFLNLPPFNSSRIHCNENMALCKLVSNVVISHAMDNDKINQEIKSYKTINFLTSWNSTSVSFSHFKL